MNKPDLPKGVVVSDLKYPKDGAVSTLNFYKIKSFGWVITTLPISGSSRMGPPRTYGIIVDSGKQCRVGKGPHVEKVITVYVSRGRQSKLQHLIDLKVSGEETANQVRDRISSRRAQGQVMRAAGRQSWRWDE